MALTKVRNRMVDFGGGIYLGGTGAANKLDDYEEGFWTPTISSSSGSLTLDSGYNLLGYTKVGRVVTITGQIVVTSVSNPSGILTLGDLPFEMFNGYKNASQTRPSIHVYASGTGAPSASYYPAFIAFNEGSRSGGIVITYNSTFQSSAANWMGSGSDIFINFSYHTA